MNITYETLYDLFHPNQFELTQFENILFDDEDKP